MKRNSLLILLFLLPFLSVMPQPKQNGRIPAREKRGYDLRKVIGNASIRILYALNAKDVRNEDTYLDLGKLEVGQGISKYSSEFLSRSDRKAVQWKKTTKAKGNVPKSFWMGGLKTYKENWSELVFSEYFVKGNKLTEWACMPLWAENNNGRYTEAWPLMRWNLHKEYLLILGHRCQRATSRFRGNEFEAWFAPDIPFKGGPWKFGGLPGCILKVQDLQKKYVWEAVAIDRGNFPILQYPERLYPKTTRSRIWKLQKKYNADYWNAIGMVWSDVHVSKRQKFSPIEKE